MEYFVEATPIVKRARRDLFVMGIISIALVGLIVMWYLLRPLCLVFATSDPESCRPLSSIYVGYLALLVPHATMATTSLIAGFGTNLPFLSSNGVLALLAVACDSIIALLTNIQLSTASYETDDSSFRKAFLWEIWLWMVLAFVLLVLALVTVGINASAVFNTARYYQRATLVLGQRLGSTLQVTLLSRMPRGFEWPRKLIAQLADVDKFLALLFVLGALGFSLAPSGYLLFRSEVFFFVLLFGVPRLFLFLWYRGLATLNIAADQIEDTTIMPMSMEMAAVTLFCVVCDAGFQLANIAMLVYSLITYDGQLDIITSVWVIALLALVVTLLALDVAGFFLVRWYQSGVLNYVRQAKADFPKLMIPSNAEIRAPDNIELAFDERQMAMYQGVNDVANANRKALLQQREMMDDRSRAMQDGITNNAKRIEDSQNVIQILRETVFPTGLPSAADEDVEPGMGDDAFITMSSARHYKHM